MDVKKGQVIALTEGEYSDYCLKDHVRALVDFDSLAMKEKFVAEDETPHRNQVDRFVDWLTRQGIIEVLEPGEVLEWWLGTWLIQHADIGDIKE